MTALDELDSDRDEQGDALTKLDANPERLLH